jgi:hypothetical protein
MSGEGAPTPSGPPPSLLSSLELLRLLSDESRDQFFAVVARQLSCSPPLPEAVATASLADSFGLAFTDDEPARLLLGTKVLLLRMASRPYEEDAAAPKALQADLVAAGIPSAAAEWIGAAGEAAVRPCAAEIRGAQAHAVSCLSHDYLEDFDWQANHVLGSSQLSHIHQTLVTVQLQIRKAGADGPSSVEQMELTPSELETTVASLESASKALQALP